MENIKQIIVMRTDLNMRKGKMIAQGSHASMAWLTNRLRPNLNTDQATHFSLEEVFWLDGSFTKIAVQVKSEEELLEIYNKAKEANLTVELITDNGLTEFNGVPTKTCLAIGPNKSSEIDPVTRYLNLL